MLPLSRREFCSLTALGLAGGYHLSHAQAADVAVKSPNSRWRIGAIGMRYQGTVITREALPFGDVVAICDVDRHVREQARASFGSTAKLYEDYRDLLADGKIDVVLIGAPDHWHVKMAVEACRAKKDVYVEKPLSLTIDEGKLMCRAVQETGRVVQVGTWQRSDRRFRQAAEMVRAGRIGKVRKVTVALGKNQTGGPFEVMQAPKNLNWDRWLGPSPEAAYIPERCHYTFRFWYDYAGGEVTDTGAHHLDIAQWAIGMQNTGPVSIGAEAKLPQVENGFNVPIDFALKMKYADGTELEMLDQGRNGILFEGDDGRVFVNRGTIAGKPVDDLAQKPFARSEYSLYRHDDLKRPELSGKLDAIKNHMANFYDCTLSRQQPISDVFSQHRTASACHLGNLAIRLDRALNWDPLREQFVDDSAADAMLRRPQRKGYEIG